MQGYYLPSLPNPTCPTCRRFPEIHSETSVHVSAGVEVLKQLVNTPYVGGTTYIVAVRWGIRTQ